MVEHYVDIVVVASSNLASPTEITSIIISFHNEHYNWASQGNWPNWLGDRLALKSAGV